MDFTTQLQRYAELTVKVGLNLRPGQRLIIIKAPLEAAPLIRLITAEAYKAGARLVDIFWYDDELTLARLRHAPRDSFAEVAEWKYQGLLQAVQQGDAVLSVRGEAPDLGRGFDPDLVSEMQRSQWTHFRPALDILSRNGTNWTVIAAPIPSWAAKVYPDLPPQEGVARLWQQIFRFCRLDTPDPVAAWQQHARELSARCAHMNARQYVGLHLRGGGNDFRIGLPAGHVWMGGSGHTLAGHPFNANLPTEEIFTLPHKDQTEGVVKASLPLSYGGQLMEDFSLTFAGGRVVDLQAAAGEDALRNLIGSDEGAARLGEIALVPHSSPIAQSGALFYDGLIDENAACHLALGKAYAFNLTGGDQMTAEELAAAGANASLVHVDFMIGSPALDVDGLTADGRAEPVLRGGEWAFAVAG